MEKRGLIALIFGVLILVSISFIFNVNYVNANAFGCTTSCGSNEIQWPDCTCHPTTSAGGETRAELCAKYSQNSKIYNCCINGIDDYDTCMASDQSGQSNGNTGNTNNQANTQTSSDHRSLLHSQQALKLYDDALAAYESGNTPDPSLSAAVLKERNDMIIACFHGSTVCTECANGYVGNDNILKGEISPYGHLWCDNCVKTDQTGCKCEQSDYNSDVSCVKDVQSQYADINLAESYAQQDWQVSPSKSITTKGTDQKNTTPLSQPEIKFSVPQASKHYSATTGDTKANEIYTQIHSAIAEKQSQLADKVTDYVKEYKTKINAQTNEVVSINLPADSPFQSVVAVANKSLTEATMTVTTIDEVNLEKAVPPLGGKGIIGNPDYPVPILPLTAPSSDKYDIQYILKVENKMPTDEGSSVYYKEAFFNFVLGGTEADAKKTSLLHYDESKKEWIPLPTQYYTTKDAYGRYVFTSHTPSFSYFAIVREKESPQSSSSSFSPWIIIVIVLVVAIFLYSVRSWLKEMIPPKFIELTKKTLAKLNLI